MSEAKDDLIARLGPVAWRVKDYADGWIFYIDERRALIEAEIMACALVEPLYSASTIASLTEQVEQAFRDGITYGTNVHNADPNIAWQHSRARASLSNTSEGGKGE